MLLVCMIVKTAMHDAKLVVCDHGKSGDLESNYQVSCDLANAKNRSSDHFGFGIGGIFAAN